jgi:hypothetical protein
MDRRKIYVLHLAVGRNGKNLERFVWQRFQRRSKFEKGKGEIMDIKKLRQTAHKTIKRKEGKERAETAKYKEDVKKEARQWADRIIKEIPQKAEQAAAKGELGIYAFEHSRGKNYCYDGDAKRWKVASEARYLISEWCKKKGFAVETYEHDQSVSDDLTDEVMTLWISWKK